MRLTKEGTILPLFSDIISVIRQLTIVIEENWGKKSLAEYHCTPKTLLETKSFHKNVMYIFSKNYKT